MSDDQTIYLETFPEWLKSLGKDAECVAALLGTESIALHAREQLAGGLNYLFKSLDLIPDGIDDIGYVDDAFVLRVSAELATMEAGMGGDTADELATIAKLAEDCELLRSFLGDDYGRLRDYVKGLKTSSARGRSVHDILGAAEVRTAFVSDIQGFSAGYEAPSFGREMKNLIKLRAFLDAKLPR